METLHSLNHADVQASQQPTTMASMPAGPSGRMYHMLSEDPHAPVTIPQEDLNLIVRGNPDYPDIKAWVKTHQNGIIAVGSVKNGHFEHLSLGARYKRERRLGASIDRRETERRALSQVIQDDELRLVLYREMAIKNTQALPSLIDESTELQLRQFLVRYEADGSVYDPTGILVERLGYARDINGKITEGTYPAWSPDDKDTTREDYDPTKYVSVHALLFAGASPFGREQAAPKDKAVETIEQAQSIQPIDMKSKVIKLRTQRAQTSRPQSWSKRTAQMRDKHRKAAGRGTGRYK